MTYGEAGHVAFGLEIPQGLVRLAQIRKTQVERFTLIRSEEHTSELQSLMRISYAVFCLKKKTTTSHHRRQQIKTGQSTTGIEASHLNLKRTRQSIIHTRA